MFTEFESPVAKYRTRQYSFSFLLSFRFQFALATRAVGSAAS